MTKQFRKNPEMPPAEKLAELYDLAVIDNWGGDVVALANSTVEDQQTVGFRAVWRHGCDTGMVAE